MGERDESGYSLMGGGLASHGSCVCVQLQDDDSKKTKGPSQEEFEKLQTGMCNVV